jgi:acetolactate synthase-1/2/3 large subunit
MGQATGQTGNFDRAADVLAGALVGHGVRHVFGMPGSHSATLYDAIARRDEVETILVRNEQAGAFCADGYARASGRPGVLCTTAGPGATNAVTGLAEAWADSVPLLLLAGHVNADRMHQECGAYHEVDLPSLLIPITKFCDTLRDPKDTLCLFNRAFATMTTGRVRPAALVLPQDVMARPAVGPMTTEAVPAPPPLAPDEGAIRNAAGLLCRAERPVVLAGGGCLWAGAGDLVRAVAEQLRAPVVTTLNGKGVVDESHPLSLGHARSARARSALRHADAMLAVGCRFTEVMTGWRTMPVPPCLVQVDIDPGQLGMNHPVALGLVADAKAALAALLPRLRANERGGWGELLDEARSARTERPEWLIEALREVVPDESPVFTDACEIGYRMHTDWPVRGPRRFFYPSNYIALGWGFPAAVGGAVALGGETPVFSVSGDGGFLMTAQELATAARYRLPVVAVVHNDSAYGAIKNIQKRAHAGRYRDVDLNNPDFVKLAESFGVPARRVGEPDALRFAVVEALGRRGPSLIEVPDTWRPIRV